MPLAPKTKRKKRKKKAKRAVEKMTLTGFRKITWNLCSRYVRLRDCISTTGTKEWGRCVTCGQLFHISKLQAGHFTSGRTDAVLYETNGIHAQCCKCNVFRSGEWPIYYRYMQKEFGQDEIERLIDLSLSDVELTAVQLRDWYIRFKDGIKELENLVL